MSLQHAQPHGLDAVSQEYMDICHNIVCLVYTLSLALSTKHKRQREEQSQMSVKGLHTAMSWRPGQGQTLSEQH